MATNLNHSSSSSTRLPLQDRVAIVTGASRGIGKAIALHLASLGAKLVINYTSESSQAQAEEVATQINSNSSTPRAIVFRADVSDPAQVKALFDAAEQAFEDQLHILVTNAGLGHRVSIMDTDVSEFDRIFSVNTRGTFLCIKEGASRIKRGGGGRIVTMSSSLAAAFRPSTAVYTASKAAVEAMTKILAKELKGTKITANCVAPGPIETDMFLGSDGAEERVRNAINERPLERLGKVEDVAPLVGLLVSDAGELVNGQVIRINGGYV